MDEIIRVAFSPDGRAARTSSIWQYDRGRKLQITGLELPASYEVQFANCPHATAKRVVVYDTDTVEIPEEFTQMGEPVYVYIYIVGDTYGITERLAVVPVKKRGMRSDEEPDPQEVDTIDTLINALNGAVAQTAQDVADTTAAKEAAEAAAEAAENYSNIAGQHAQDASASKDAAQIAQTGAETARANADTAAASASASATDAILLKNQAELAAQNAEESARISTEAVQTNIQLKNQAQVAEAHAREYADDAMQGADEAWNAVSQASEYSRQAGDHASNAEAAQEAAEYARDEAQEAIAHGPKIEDDTWYVWDQSSQSYVYTGVRAVGQDATNVIVGIKNFVFNCDKNGRVKRDTSIDVRFWGYVGKMSTQCTYLGTAGTTGRLNFTLMNNADSSSLGGLLVVSCNGGTHISINGENELYGTFRLRFRCNGMDFEVPCTWNSVCDGAKGDSYNLTEEDKAEIATLVDGMHIHICTSQEYNSETGVPTIVTPDTETFYLVPGGDGNNLFIEWAYVNGAWERFGSADVDLSNYVQKTDYATRDNAGVVKINAAGGIGINKNSHALGIFPSSETDIKNGTEFNRPIVPYYQHASTFYGLAKAAGDTTQSQSSNAVGTYTDEAKAAIQQMLDVPSKSEIPDTSIYATKTEVPVENGTGAGSVKTKDFVANDTTYTQTASGIASFAEGRNTVASGNRSHAEGNNTIASGSDSHAEGAFVEANGHQSHAEGMYTQSNGITAHAEGEHTRANGESSHAEGYSTKADGKASHAEGYNTIAFGAYTHVGGTYNVPESVNDYEPWQSGKSYKVGDLVRASVGGSALAVYVCTVDNEDTTFVSSHWTAATTLRYAEMIGNGSYSNRSNAYALTWTGDGHYAGDVYVHSNADSTGGTKLATIEDVGVQDVQVNGTSVVSGGVANVPVGNDTNPGVFKTGTYGVGVYNYDLSRLCVKCAQSNQVKAGADNYMPIVPSKQHESVFYGLAKAAGSDEKNSTLPVGQYTNSAKTAIQTMLDVPSKSDIPENVSELNNDAGYLTEHQDLSDYALNENVVMVPGTGVGSARTRDFEYNGQVISNEASGRGAFVEGNYNIASGNFTHAEGAQNVASGGGSHVEGQQCVSAGTRSHAEGMQTFSGGVAAHTEGGATMTIAQTAHAEGLNTFAAGNASHAEGLGSTYAITISGENANYAYAEDVVVSVGDYIKYDNHVYKILSVDDENKTFNTTLTDSLDNVRVNVFIRNTAGVGSHTEGESTKAYSNYQHAQGKYNIADNQNVYADIVGNGEDDSNRSNAFALTWTGDGRYAGDVYVHANADSTGGTKLATIEDIPDAPVQDVQVNGTSVVSNGVANVPIGNGLYSNNGALDVNPANSTQIKQSIITNRPIAPYSQHLSTFYGLAKAAGADEKNSTLPVGTYTDNAKASIKSMLGIVDGSTGTVDITGATPTINAVENTRYVCGEVTSLSFTPPSSGISIVRFTSGSTVTVLTIPSTVKFPEWFDPTTLETNTIYEICVTDGTFGAVMSWAL